MLKKPLCLSVILALSPSAFGAMDEPVIHVSGFGESMLLAGRSVLVWKGTPGEIHADELGCHRFYRPVESPLGDAVACGPVPTKEKGWWWSAPTAMASWAHGRRRDCPAGITPGTSGSPPTASFCETESQPGKTLLPITFPFRPAEKRWFSPTGGTGSS